MERHEILDAMSELKLYGMRTSFDEVAGKGLTRRDEIYPLIASLLRASHIIPWSECESDAERLDVHNGLLLSALWDAAFDRALVTFDDDGEPEFSLGLSERARAELRWDAPISLTDEHRRLLARHRARARYTL